MHDPIIKQNIISLSNEVPVSAIISLYTGIVPAVTIYRWVSQKPQQYSYSYSLDAQLREWERLKRTPGTYESVPHTNRIITSNQPHFYDAENKLLQDPKIRAKLNANRLKYKNKSLNQLTPKEILRGMKISGIYTGYSHFNPYWIKAFISEFQPQCIYDPCGGWGHRLLGATASSCKYIYNDKWNKTVIGIQNICKQLKLTVPIYNNSCESFTPTESYDCVFTCPPYYNIETYEDSFDSLASYANWWEQVVTKTTTTSMKLFAFVINHTYQDLLITTTKKILQVDPIVKPLGARQSHFNQNTSSRSENLVIFSR